MNKNKYILVYGNKKKISSSFEKLDEVAESNNITGKIFSIRKIPSVKIDGKTIIKSKTRKDLFAKYINGKYKR